MLKFRTTVVLLLAAAELSRAAPPVAPPWLNGADDQQLQAREHDTRTGNNEQQLANDGGGSVLVREKRQAKKNKKGNKQLEIECLAAHNKWRRAHKVPDLQWDDKLAAFAQKRSNHIANSDGAEFGHPPGLPYGENLFWHSSTDTPCDFMVRGWYDEIKLYNYKKPTFAAETGHFTQVIWRDTQKVGCAVATSSGQRGGVYLTCSYDPAGNFIGEFEQNVPLRAGLENFASGARAGAAKPPLKPLPVTTAPPSTTTTTTTSTTKAQITTVAPSTSTSAPTESSSQTKKPKSKKKGNKKKNKNKDKKKNKKKNKNKKKKKNANISNNNATTTTPPSIDTTTLVPL